jgi:hypothetical protein
MAAAILFGVGVLGLMGTRCGEPQSPRPEARMRSALPGSCDGSVDYADELRVSRLMFNWVRPVGLDLFEVNLDVELSNAGDARFRSASLTPDFASAPAELQSLASPAPLAADFGPIEPFGSAWSTAPLLVHVPAQLFDDLMRGLGDGTIPVIVHADEENVFAPNVEIHLWTATEDSMYETASQLHGYGPPPNQDPGPGPFAPGQGFFVFFLAASDDIPTVFDAYEPGDRFYLVEDPDDPLGGALRFLPDAYDRVRVVSAERADEEGDDYTLWAVGIERTDDESLPDLYSTASLCSAPGSHIDPPVQATPLFSLDNDVVEDAVRDGHAQPLRANELTLSDGIVTFSGQIAGHVLKPSLSLRLRHGHVEAGATFDTELSLTAELRAEDAATLEPDAVELWRHCFPLPALPIGPALLPIGEVPMSLQISQDVGISGSIGAGVVVGLEKRFESGFSILCQGGPGVPEDCSSERHGDDTPIQLIPPQLTEATGFALRTETALHALLRVGSPYPECATGPGISLDTTAFAESSVTPAQDPWWQSDYGVEVTGAIDLDVFGLDIARFETGLFSRDDGATSSDMLPASPESPGSRTSGADQRWAVAIDATSEPNGVSTTSIVALPDGSSLTVATEPVAGRNPIVKLDRAGALVWTREFAKKVLRVRALPDGTAVAVGTNAWIARVDADGDLLWSFDAELSRTGIGIARCILADVVPLELAAGVYDYVGLGRMGTNLVTTTDACAFRVRADGTLAWQRIYVGDRGQQFLAGTATRDGGVAAVGYDHWEYVGNRTVPLFAKLDAATGDVVWAKRLPMTRLAGLSGVTEASDGTLFGVGNAQGIISSTGASVVARIGPDGSDARHALVFQDEEWEALLDYEVWANTAGGDSAYDGYYEIAPSGDGFVVVGQTGLGADSAARVAKLNANLGVVWMTTFDGIGADVLSGVAPLEDGLLVSGYSDSLPEPDGPNSGENQLWVMKLPFTGSLELLPEAGMTTRYLVPGVRWSSADAGVNPLAEPSIDAAFAIEQALTVSAGPNTGLLVAPSDYCVELLTGTGSVSALDACAD